jgi:erythromycin esterase-like protein
MTIESFCHRLATQSLAIALLAASCSLPSLAAAATGPTMPLDHDELDPAVRDLCGKQVVLLGEDGNHGSGATLAIKGELVKRLIDECKFSAVMFESQIYDFIALQRAFDNKTATRAQLADAIGGLWSTTREIDPLVTTLFDRARAGRMTLSGLDPQVGGATQVDTRQHLASRLAAMLVEPRRADCATAIGRLTNWQFDADTPYDDAYRASLRGCVADIQAVAGDTTTLIEARNLSAALDMSTGDAFNVRDRAMYDNFVWQSARLTRGAKVIVWTATVHATKRAVPGQEGRQPLGYFIDQQLGARAASVGFSAVSGSYGRQGQSPTALDVPSPQSLESQAFADQPSRLRYLDKAQLIRLGVIDGRPINYAKPIRANWAELLDGILVLRQERPPHYLRPATPQQTKAAGKTKGTN